MATYYATRNQQKSFKKTRRVPLKSGCLCLFSGKLKYWPAHGRMFALYPEHYP
jgi:hypothetical protein